MHIGNRIQILRNHRGLTLKEAAETVTSTSYLAKIEEGNHPPRPHVLSALETQLGVSEGFLVNYSKRDEDAEYLLKILQSNIVLHPDKAKEIIEVIEENYYEYLSPIPLEATYLCLKCAYYFKMGDTQSAIDIYETHITKYIDETELKSYPKLVRESFNYMMSLKTFSESRIKESTHYMEMFVDSVDHGPAKGAVIYNIALLYGMLNLNHKAIQFALRAKALFEHTKKYDMESCKTNNLLAAQYMTIKQYEEAMNFLDRAEKIAEIYNYSNLLSRIYHNKGLIHKNKENYDLAVKYLESSLELKKQTKNEDLWLTYKALMDSYLLDENKQSADKLYGQLLNELPKELESTHFLYIYFINYILKYKKEDEHILLDSIQYLESKKRYDSLKGVYKVLGDHYLEENNFKLASKYYKQELSHIDFEGGIE
ncbi:helix-turn-helix domain-containing protein [Thalassobacillus hwangdonensis]|uniref:Helix-turn-helix domain-containing protein n=1 Tax=Thalassobacillus hwangdonensis TaxID=546108 RepID=A0ABW3KY52_9BACI